MYLEQYDFSKSIRSYDFTHKSEQNIKRLKDTDAFRQASAKTIFEYLTKELEFVQFSDYLKRYLYKKTDMKKPFHEFLDDDYKYIIVSSFEETNTPRSLSPDSTAKWNCVLKQWLHANTAERKTVFQLGFGLRMTPDDVSEFLIKVLKTEDFDFSDPREVINWFAYKNKLTYAQANELFEKSKHLSDEDYISAPVIYNAREIDTEDHLFSYLMQKKKDSTVRAQRELAYHEFMELFEKTKHVAAKIFSEPDLVHLENDEWDENMIKPSHIEMILNSGVPLTKGGKFATERASLFYPYIKNVRLSRQRLSALIKKRYPVKRTDLITLSFFNCSYEFKDSDPTDRFCKFVDETNNLLRAVGMLELYPVNPYESFILLSLLTEHPFETYTDVIESSYDPSLIL